MFIFVYLLFIVLTVLERFRARAGSRRLFSAIGLGVAAVLLLADVALGLLQDGTLNLMRVSLLVGVVLIFIRWRIFIYDRQPRVRRQPAPTTTSGPPAQQPASPPPAIIRANRAAIQRELGKLLDLTNRHFLILTHADSGRFVQFLGPGADTSTLTIDVPVVHLDADEALCARDCFFELGLQPVEGADYPPHLMAVVTANLAAEVALCLLKSVHNVPADAPLEVNLGAF